MTTAINGLFANATPAVGTSNGTLAGTQQLTNTASAITDNIMNIIGISDDQEVIAKIQQSMTDMSVLDKLISDNYDLGSVDIDFLKALDEETLDGMLKSQQSKRSRCKSKEMTADNYKSMMTAAIAETIIRLAIGKEKGSFGGRSGGSVAYSEERLVQLAADQEALRKEIRNVQSKKSIMKSKASFTESDERWQALLVAEGQLKSIRSDAPGATRTVVDPLREQLKELLAEVDEQGMSAKNLKELVASIKSYVWPAEPETDEQTSDEI